MTSENSSAAFRLEALVAEFLHAVDAGQQPDREALVARNPDLEAELRSFFADHDRICQAASPLRPSRPGAVDDPTLAPGEQTQEPILGRVHYFGDYELLEELGRGGMGVVYKARQVSLDRIVALKMILIGQLATEEDIRRFHAEAEAAARLDHPGIVPVFEVGRHGGHHYFSMAFVEGESLGRRLVHGLPAPREAAVLVKKVAEAIAYAHVEGVIHRDLKPANILIDRHGQPRLTDFGLAKRVESLGDKSERPMGGQNQSPLLHNARARELTATGQVLGTPSYMPPEQASGQRGVVGPLADVYSLGAVLYCLLTGRPPFQADNPLDTLLQVLDCEPVPPRQLNAAVPRDLETICLRCLEKELRKRYASAQDLVADLGRYLDGRPIVARPARVWERAVKWARRRPSVAALTMVSGLALVAIFVVALWYNDQLRAALSDSQQARGAAEKERDSANRARLVAEERELTARRYLYQAHLNLAQQAWNNSRIDRVQELLDAHFPEPGQQDVRGFEWYLLWRLCHSDRRTFAGSKAVNAVALSPDGKVLAIAGERQQEDRVRFLGFRTIGVITFWDPVTGKSLGELPGLDAEVSSLAFTPDGKTLATGGGGNEEEGFDYTVRLWDVGRQKCQAVLSGYKGPITSVCFSSDGKILATGASQSDEIAKLWDVAARKELHSLRVPGAAGTSGVAIALSPDGRTVATGNNGGPLDAALRLWDVATGKEMPRLKTQNGIVESLAFSPRNGFLAVGYADGVVRIWDVAKGQVWVTLRKDHDGILALAFSSDGTLLATAGRDRVVRVWNAARLEDDTLREFATVKGHRDVVSSVAFAPGGRALATGSWDGSAKIWDLPNGRAWTTLKETAGVVTTLGFGGDVLATASGRGVVKLWNAHTGEAQATLVPSAEAGDSTLSWPLAITVDGKTVVALDRDGTVGLWETATGQKRLALPRQEGRVNALAVSSDSRLVALVTTRDRQVVRQVAGRDFSVVEPASTVDLWNLDDGKRHLTLAADSFAVSAVAFASDGRTVAVTPVHGDGAIKLWDTASGREQASLAGPAEDVLCLAFAPDGRTLATGSFDGRARLWDLATKKERAVLRGHTQAIHSLAFAPDGLTLGTGSADGSAKLWSVATGEETLTLPQSTPVSRLLPVGEFQMLAVTFAQDGKTLATAENLGLGTGVVKLRHAATKEDIEACEKTK
jgi:WD40 repeat protein/serine/threonine protein kinase